MLSFHHITAELKVLGYMNGYASVLAFNQYYLHGKRMLLSRSQSSEPRGCDLIIIFVQNAFYEIRSQNLYDHMLGAICEFAKFINCAAHFVNS